MALLADLVETSQRVGENAARRTKIARMAEFLRRLAPAEIDIERAEARLSEMTGALA